MRRFGGPDIFIYWLKICDGQVNKKLMYTDWWLYTMNFHTEWEANEHRLGALILPIFVWPPLCSKHLGPPRTYKEEWLSYEFVIRSVQKISSLIYRVAHLPSRSISWKLLLRYHQPVLFSADRRMTSDSFHPVPTTIEHPIVVSMQQLGA